MGSRGGRGSRRREEVGEGGGREWYGRRERGVGERGEGE